jgi:phosphatidylserine/phosphatidylglycerophosphate/cardiolipin synthase-like enzyme
MSEKSPPGPAIQDPSNSNPPKRLMERKVVVHPGQVNTVRLMHDPKLSRRRWSFDTERHVREGNEVDYLIRGEETYAAMAEAIKSAARFAAANKKNKALVYLLGWSCEHENVSLIPGDPKSTLKELLILASSSGVEIRAMLWANVTGPGDASTAVTKWPVIFINTLPNARAVLDAKTVVLADLPLILRRRGSHHQKVLITHDETGLTAFCGGVDVARNRTDDGFFGWQDVHCRIRGPAAHDLLLLFADRWNDYLNEGNPDASDHDLYPPRLPPTTLRPQGQIDHSRDFLSAPDIPVPIATGKQFVQIGRTTPTDLYPGFCKRGEQSARKMILKGIESAQSFIYMEDQYLLNLECADALAKAAAKASMKYIIIVVPNDETIDMEFFGVASFHRAEFVKRLRAGAGASKISIHCADRYVHSKMLIVDDKYAIIGSANVNRRGWEHDSEVVAGIFDESSDKKATLHFARRLRMKLWADHLNLAGGATQPNRPANSQDEYAELADGVASAVHWRKRPPKARVHPYVPRDNKGESAMHALERNLKAEDHLHVSRYMGNQISMLKRFRILTEQGIWDTVIDPASPLRPEWR